MPAFQARAWCFTYNNPAFPAEDLPAHANERYIVWQQETGEQGTTHLQGYVELTRPASLASVTAWLPGAHFEARKGTREQARAYCMKEDSRDSGPEAGPFERGEFSRGGSGARNDLAEAVVALKEGGIKRVAETCPTAFVKYARGLRELERELQAKPRDIDFVPRVWQAYVLDQLTAEPDDRTIYWITDTHGNNGKSRLARHLVMEHDGIQLEGKVADMTYAYNGQRIVIIDITRAQADNTKHLYSFAEKLKNGMLFNTKYESAPKHFHSPHVIFMSNASWDREAWTNDRVHEIDLNNPEYHVY